MSLCVKVSWPTAHRTIKGTEAQCPIGPAVRTGPNRLLGSGRQRKCSDSGDGGQLASRNAVEGQLDPRRLFARGRLDAAGKLFPSISPPSDRAGAQRTHTSVGQRSQSGECAFHTDGAAHPGHPRRDGWSRSHQRRHGRVLLQL